MTPRRRNLLVHGAIVAVACALNVAANASLAEPPRYDGAGYAVLARSLLDGRVYREIDRPDAPRHAHFPPGYPLALATLWSMTGPSIPAAHAFSVACTIAASVLAWAWFRTWARPGVALWMGLAVAANWRWGRDGSAVRSEPLFLLLGGASVLASAWVGRRGGTGRAAVLGLLLGAATLTRHVGLALVAAVVADLWLKGRRRDCVVALSAASVVLARWAAWLVRIPGDTQVGLVPTSSLADTIFLNTWFYGRRMIDQVIGPIIEVATVFRPRWALAGTIAAAAALAPIVLGWVRLARRPRSRAAALVPALALAMLLAWPFTEAGRFLVPLVPFVVAGLAEGLARWAARAGVRRARLAASACVLGASLPYSLYAIATRRADAERATHRDFDAACAWIAAHPDPPGPVLSRHPGEVFLLTGRTGIGLHEPDVNDRVDDGRVVYWLDDGARFARDVRAPDPGPPTDDPAFLARLEAVGRWGGVVVYRVRPPKLD